MAVSLLYHPDFLKHFSEAQRKEFKSPSAMLLCKPVRVNEPFRTQWIDALVSGAYRQAPSLLFNPDAKGMCCLGVACDITHHTVKPIWTQRDGRWGNGGTSNTNRFDAGLPTAKTASMWFPDYVSGGVEEGSAADGVDCFLSVLIALNDSHKFSFTDIARVIDHCTVSA